MQNNARINEMMNEQVLCKGSATDVDNTLVSGVGH